MRIPGHLTPMTEPSPQTDAKITTAQLTAAIAAARKFFPCAWGSETAPISEGEARALVRRVFEAAGFEISSSPSHKRP